MKPFKSESLFLILLILALCPMFSPAIQAQQAAPTNLRPFHFRSILHRQDGSPVTGLQFLTFSIYDKKDFYSDPLWKETLPVQLDKEGRYSVQLTTGASADTAASIRNTHALLWVSTSIPGTTATTAPQVITTIPQGIYQDCNLDGQSCMGPAGDTATSQLDKIAAANFYVVLNYSSFWGTKQQLLNYAAYASNLGLNILWNFSDPDFAKYATKSGTYLINDYSELSASCSCTSNKAFIQYVVNLVKDLPATYGYSIADEPATNTASNVNNLYKIIHAEDPNHPQLVNATWDDATNPSLSNLQSNLSPFNFADILGGDYYPIGTGAPASYTATAAQDVYTVASTYGKSSQFILQAFNWSQYEPGVCPSTCTYPTTSELQTMLSDAATSAKPQILLWYTYWDTVNAGQWNNFISAVNPQRP